MGQRWTGVVLFCLACTCLRSFVCSLLLLLPLGRFKESRIWSLLLLLTALCFHSFARVLGEMGWLRKIQRMDIWGVLGVLGKEMWDSGCGRKISSERRKRGEGWVNMRERKGPQEWNCWVAFLSTYCNLVENEHSWLFWKEWEWKEWFKEKLCSHAYKLWEWIHTYQLNEREKQREDTLIWGVGIEWKAQTRDRTEKYHYALLVGQCLFWSWWGSWASTVVGK